MTWTWGKLPKPLSFNFGDSMSSPVAAQVMWLKNSSKKQGSATLVMNFVENQNMSNLHCPNKKGVNCLFGKHGHMSNNLVILDWSLDIFISTCGWSVSQWVLSWARPWRIQTTPASIGCMTMLSGETKRDATKSEMIKISKCWDCEWSTENMFHKNQGPFFWIDWEHCSADHQLAPGEWTSSAAWSGTAWATLGSRRRPLKLGGLNRGWNQGKLVVSYWEFLVETWNPITFLRCGQQLLVI